LAKTVEDVGKQFLLDALPVVGDHNARMGILAVQRDPYVSTFGREFDRVGEQVPHVSAW
jgi:hypothetical protein